MEPVKSQAWQALPHAVLQQTPSAQMPEAHSAVLVQTAPRLFLAAHIEVAPMPSQ